MVDISNSSKNFHYEDLIIELHPEVYEPAEDTFQLLEAIKLQKDHRVLELGTGCGLIALSCAREGANVICADINPYAVDLARKNYQLNNQLIKGNMEVRCGDLFSIISSDEYFDVIIFNPPYLPTKKEDRIGDTGWFDTATDGGIDGLAVTKRFLKGVSKHLAKNGFAYIVFSSLSNRAKLEKHASDAGLISKVISSRTYGDEQIDVYRFSK
jgi:release factor glutamine methyltransferase